MNFCFPQIVLPSINKYKGMERGKRNDPEKQDRAYEPGIRRSDSKTAQWGPR